MRSAPTLVLAVLALTSFAAWGGVCDDVPLVQIPTANGDQIAIYATNEEIERSPEWSPVKGEPPIRVPRAVAIAKEWAKRNFTQYEIMKISGISLRERRCGFIGNRWFYIIDFDPIVNGKILLGTAHFVAVLMDGTSIGPKIPDQP